MKTPAKTIALLVSLIILFSSNIMAISFEFADEAYINDIPFDTECMSAKCLYEAAVSVNFSINEEEYIDDIPFDTECIAIIYRYNKAMNIEFKFHDEEYIDDTEASILFAN